MYSFTSVYQWEITSFACLPEQQILECLIELLQRCEDHYLEYPFEQPFLTELRTWVHDLPTILLKAQTSLEALSFCSHNETVWVKLTVDGLGHYEFELLDDLGSDRYVAKITWINPII